MDREAEGLLLGGRAVKDPSLDESTVRQAVNQLIAWRQGRAPWVEVAITTAWVGGQAVGAGGDLVYLVHDAQLLPPVAEHAANALPVATTAAGVDKDAHILG